MLVELTQAEYEAIRTALAQAILDDVLDDDVAEQLAGKFELRG